MSEFPDERGKRYSSTTHDYYGGAVVLSCKKFSMANRKKNVFFKKLATNSSLALLLGPRGMCECLVTG